MLATIIIRKLMNLLTFQLTVLLGLGLLVVNINNQQVSLPSCLEYSNGVCIRCDRQTHIHKGLCYRNILGCTKYDGGDICLECDPSNFVLIGTTCSLLNGLSMTAELLQKLYMYGGYGFANPGDKYGQANFVPKTYEKVRTLPSFLALNTYIIRGQYGHYISRMSNPIYSVSYYTTNSTYSYKLLYHGSGGGLFLCIADVPPNMVVQLRSLTPISASNIIDFCYDYETNGTCLRCNDAYHLEGGKCYPNLGGCLKYRQNICIQCLDYYFLVENRCVSDCLSVSDARSILHFETSRNQSTLETYYGVSISQFYTVTVTRTMTTVVTTTTGNNNNIGSLGFISGTASGSGSGSGGTSIFGTTTVTNRTTTTSSSGSGTSGGSQTIISNGASTSSSNANQGATSGFNINVGSGGALTTIDNSLNWNTNNGNAKMIGNSGLVIMNSTNSTNTTSTNGGMTTITSTTTTTTFSSSGSIPNGSALPDLSALNAQLNAQLNGLSSISNSSSANFGSSGSGSQSATGGSSNSMISSSSSSSTSSSASSSSSSSSGNGTGFDSSMDPNCAVFKNDKSCDKCATFYFKNKQNVCQQVSPYCATYSEQDGRCQTCYPGYNLVQGQCNMPGG